MQYMQIQFPVSYQESFISFKRVKLYYVVWFRMSKITVTTHKTRWPQDVSAARAVDKETQSRTQMRLQWKRENRDAVVKGQTWLSTYFSCSIVCSQCDINKPTTCSEWYTKACFITCLTPGSMFSKLHFVIVVKFTFLLCHQRTWIVFRSL